MIVSDELTRSSVAGSCALGSACRCLEGVCAGQRQAAEGAQISATPAAMLGESSTSSRTGTWGKDESKQQVWQQGTWGTRACACRERQRRAQGTAQPGPRRSAGCHQCDSRSLHMHRIFVCCRKPIPRSPPRYLPPINTIYCTVNPRGRQPPWPGLSPPGFLCSQTSAPGQEQLGPGFFEMQCCEGLDLRTKSCLGRKQTGLCKRPFLALVAAALHSSCTANNTGGDALPLITSQRPSAPLLFLPRVFAPAVPAPC